MPASPSPVTSSVESEVYVPRTEADGYKLSLIYSILAVTAVVVAFGVKQNSSAMVGGPISLPKLLWLNYALIAWFVTPWFLARHPRVAPPLRRLFGWHLAVMAARGLVELWLLYVTLGWNPLYGIAHDLFQIGLIGALRREARGTENAFNRDTSRFSTALQLSLAAEITFAAWFYGTGAHRQAIYFVPSDPAYIFINSLTAAADVALYSYLVFFFWRNREALFRRVNQPCSAQG